MGFVNLGTTICEGGITHRDVSQLLRKAKQFGVTDDKRLNIIRAANTVIQDNPAALKNCSIRMTDEDLEAELVSGNGGTEFEIWSTYGEPNVQIMGKTWQLRFRNAFVSIWKSVKRVVGGIVGGVLGAIAGANRDAIGWKSR